MNDKPKLSWEAQVLSALGVMVGLFVMMLTIQLLIGGGDLVTDIAFDLVIAMVAGVIILIA
jgi:hypothetical protein